METKLNQLQLVLIVARIARSTLASPPTPAQVTTAISLLLNYTNLRSRIGDAAYTVVLCEVAWLKLVGLSVAVGGADAAAVLGEVKLDLAAATALYDTLPESTEPVVGATLHRARAAYHKVAGPPSSYYEAALAYLSVTPLGSLPPSEAVEWAHDVTVAALVGEGVYNFGERACGGGRGAAQGTSSHPLTAPHPTPPPVNGHPVLSRLANTGHAWLISLLAACQTGDIDAFQAVIRANAGPLAGEAALLAHTAQVEEKIRILAVMELAARRPAELRDIPLAEVAAAARLPPGSREAVERLLMRGLSLGLLRGKIDGVAGVMRVTYVKPRVLDAAQTRVLAASVDALKERAIAGHRFLEAQSEGLFA